MYVINDVLGIMQRFGNVVPCFTCMQLPIPRYILNACFLELATTALLAPPKHVIPWCVRRVARLGSKSLSAGAGSVWKSGNLDIQ